MACFHPSSIYIFEKPYEEKKKVIYKSNFDYQRHNLKDAIGWHHPKDSGYICTDAVLVGCGKCVGCNADNNKIWAERMMSETAYSKTAYFLTITYDDEHLPKNHQLVKKDLRDFIKKIRNFYYQKFNYDGIRFYAVGEYGSKSARPHYHAIIWNMPLYDIDFYAMNLDRPKFHIKKVGYSETSKENLVEVKELSDLWNKGYVVVGNVSRASCNYVARYVNKKKLSGVMNKDLKYLGIESEFSLMSRRPGIGFTYYDQNWRKLLNNNLVYFIDGEKFIASRYFEKYLEKYHPDYLSLYKELKDNYALYGKANNARLKNEFGSINAGLVEMEKQRIMACKSLKRKL